MLKVLHCIHSLSNGGAERQLCLLANASQAVGMQAEVFCVDKAGHSISNTDIGISVLSDTNRYPLSMRDELIAVVENFSPDVIHTWLPAPMNVAVLSVAGKYKIPAVASYRNRRRFDSWQRIPDFLAMFFWADKIISNNPVSQSSFLYRKLFKYKGGDEISNAVSITDNLKSKENSHSEVKRFIFVGRLTHQKNWHTMIKAFSRLSVNQPWKLVICGDGEDRQALEEEILNLGIKDHVELKGFCDNIYQEISDSDFLLLPSWYEGMPNVVLEAMALGVPCGVSLIPAHESLFDRSIVEFFDPNSVDQLLNVITKVVTDDIDLIKQSKKVLAFSEKFTPQVMAKKYLSVYKILVDNK